MKYVIQTSIIYFIVSFIHDIGTLIEKLSLKISHDISLYIVE